MKKALLMAALFGLVACGGTTVGGGGAGTGGTKSVTPVACLDCLSQGVAWTWDGGLTLYTPNSSLTSCRTYTYSRGPGSEGPPVTPTSCTVELGGCDAGPGAIHDVEQALADPDVTAALAGSTPLYGSDPRPCDGAVLAISVGSRTIEVGGDCSSGTCLAGQGCVPIPAGVQALADLLTGIDQASIKQGSCASAFP